MNYTVVVGSDGPAKLYGVDSMPATFPIGRDGRIVRTDLGRFVDRAECERESRRLLVAERSERLGTGQAMGLPH
jgi:hypothetical protein